MPTTLPVPSKGALRALRNLALGTSCTLAISAGLLTEDRRRRIRAAREIHNNAQRIKSSRNYTVGTAAIQTFEDQVLSYQDEEFWQQGNTLNRTALSRSDRTIDFGAQGSVSSYIHTSPNAVSEKAKKRNGVAKLQPKSASLQNPHQALKTGKLFVPGTPKLHSSDSQALPIVNNTQNPIVDDSRDLTVVPSTSEILFFENKANKRQERLAYDVANLLAESPPNIDDAAVRLFEAFEEGLIVDDLGLLEALKNAVIELGKACRQHSRFEILEKILNILGRYGPIHEDQFYELAPDKVIGTLIHREAGNTTGLISISNLQKAASIYLTRFREKPKVTSQRMLKLGEKLCRETCRSGLYPLTTLIFNRLEACRGDNPMRGVSDFILATQKLGHHENMSGIFEKYYIRTSPDQLQHWKTLNLVIDSILQTDRPHEAEEVLTKATDMAKANGLTMSTTAVLKVLGNNWRTYKDINRTKSMFERLRSTCSITNHARACYGAMIQFCVEANDESAAELYYARLRDEYKESPEDICIYGHLARAKAMRQDWAGVEVDFHKMKILAPTRHADFSASFTPILKLFAKSHSTLEIEEFVRKFINECDLRLTGYMMNIMVNVYAKAKEIDSIARWVDYTSSIGCSIDSIFFNIILNQCYHTWKFSRKEVFDLFETVRQMNHSSRFIDKDTTSVLRQINLVDGQMLKPEEQAQMESLEQSITILDPRAVHTKMASTLGVKNFIATLGTYVCALRKSAPLDARHLHLAIKATLSLNPKDLDACITLIQDADRRGWETQDAIAMVLTHQSKRIFDNGTNSANDFVDLAQRSILDFQKRGIKVPLTIVTHTMSILQRMYYFRAALDFWDSTSRRLGLSVTSLDLESLTVFLNIYIGLRDSAGIQWVLETVSTNNLIPDYHFRLTLKTERRRLGKLLRSGSCPRDTLHYSYDVEEACRVVSEIEKKSCMEKDHVKLMTIKIIEKAIIDQKASERTKIDMPHVPSEIALGQDVIEDDSWSAMDEEIDHNMGHLPPLACSVAGG